MPMLVDKDGDPFFGRSKVIIEKAIRLQKIFEAVKTEPYNHFYEADLLQSTSLYFGTRSIDNVLWRSNLKEFRVFVTEYILKHQIPSHSSKIILRFLIRDLCIRNNCLYFQDSTMANLTLQASFPHAKIYYICYSHIAARFCLSCYYSTFSNDAASLFFCGLCEAMAEDGYYISFESASEPFIIS